MKTTWNQTYLDSKMSPAEQHRWRQDTAINLYNKTGVHWSYATQNGYTVFRPYIDFTQPVEDISERDQLELIRAWRTQADNILGIVDFITLKENTLFSYTHLLKIAHYMVKNNKAVIHVDRVGKPTFFKVKK